FVWQGGGGIRDWSVTGVQTCALPIFFGKKVWASEFAGDRPPLLQRAEDLADRGQVELAVAPERVGRPAGHLVAGRVGPEQGLDQIGRASCRERGAIWVEDVSWRRRTR